MTKLFYKNSKFLGFFLLIVSFIFMPMLADAHKIVIAQGIDPMSLDPHISANIPTMGIHSNLYDTLISRDLNLKIIPALATSFENISPTKWRFYLRKGVTFHNGEPFNAEAVKFSWERIYNPAIKSPQKGWFNTIEKVDVIDDHTLDFITKKPDPVLPARLHWFFVIPPNYVRKIGDIKFNLKPIGAGPYRFVKWIRDDKLVLRRNENYWAGVPQIEEVVYRVMPEAQARIAGLQTGEIDIATNIPPDLAESLKGAKDFDFRATLSTRFIFLQLDSIQESPLLKKKVRQAINYAIDRDKIVKYILMGYGEKRASLIPKPVFAFDPNLKPYPYNPAKAKQLLVEAGYPNGIEITMNGCSGRYMRDKEVCQAVAGQLTQAGIKVNLKILEWGTHISKITSHTAAPIYLIGWAGLDPDLILWPNLHSGEAFSQTNDKKIDDDLSQARHEIDRTKREKLYNQINKYVYDQAYVAPLHQQRDLYGVNKRISFKPRADEFIFLKDIKLIK